MSNHAAVPASPHRVRSPLSARELNSLTAKAEKKVLITLARRLPAWVQPDHLSALGFLAMAGAGLCYRLIMVSPLFLLGANLCLFLNWFGDSLDGTLARVRERQRPRYGFYVDHLLDALGASVLLAGLGSSGLIAPFAACGLLVAYLLLQIHIALKAHATGVFQIAFNGIGGTEARILMALLNLAVLVSPQAQGAGTPLALLLTLALLGLVISEAIKTGAALDGEERRLWNSRESPSVY